MAARAQAEQADIDQRQPYPGDQPGNDRVAGDQRRRLDTTGTDRVHDDDAEHQCPQGIHGQVTIDEPLGKRRRDVFRGRHADVAGRQGKRGDAQHRQGDDLQWREEASDGIQQPARIERDEEHHQEIQGAVEKQCQRTFAGQRRQADFERHGRGTRRGEQRADGQVADRCQQTAGELADGAAQGIHRPADFRQGDHGDHWQSDRRDQEAQRRHPDMGPGLQTDDRWEDDVAGPDEQGKCHETKRQDVLAFQHFH